MESFEDDYAAVFDDVSEDMNAREFFHKLLLKHTQDFGLLCIDQTQPHYDMADMFYWDKSDDPDCTQKFKVGSNKFWEQSGNRWDEQQRQVYNVQKNYHDVKQETWKQRGLKKLKEDEEEEKNKAKIEQVKLTTSSPYYAPTDVQKAINASLKLKYGIGHGGHSAKALENVKHALKYIPAPSPSSSGLFSSRKW